MNETQANNIRHNLWIFRLRRKIPRHVFVRDIMSVQAYREIEYGHEAISPDMLKKFIEKYDLKRKHLTTAPDFASLLDHPTRKLIEYQRVAMSSTQGKHLMHFLRDFLPRTY